MSFDGHVLCQRILIAPCALTTLGAATLAAVASAAPLRNLRRVAAADGDLFGIPSSLAYKLRDDVLRQLLRLTQPTRPYSGRTVVGGDIGPHKAPIVSPPRRWRARRGNVNNNSLDNLGSPLKSAEFAVSPMCAPAALAGSGGGKREKTRGTAAARAR